MGKKNDGEPAFPRISSGQYGMSLRDYFAAKAMAAKAMPVLLKNTPNATYELIAKWAYEMADEMISAGKANND